MRRKFLSLIWIVVLTCLFFLPLSVQKSAGEWIQQATSSQAPASGWIESHEPGYDTCAECHNDPIEKLPAVTEAQVTQSVHAGLDCIDCHTAVSKVPHKEELPPPECKGCHADVAAIYKQHGRSKIGDSEDIPISIPGSIR